MPCDKLTQQDLCGVRSFAEEEPLFGEYSSPFSVVAVIRRFPSDDEFRSEIKVRDLYNFRSRSYWLLRLENHDRKELVPLTEYTIEHILPQNENLSRAWRNALGEDWRQLRDTLLHTLGNLTLTAITPNIMIARSPRSAICRVDFERAHSGSTKCSVS